MHLMHGSLFIHDSAQHIHSCSLIAVHQGKTTAHEWIRPDAWRLTPQEYGDKVHLRVSREALFLRA